MIAAFRTDVSVSIGTGHLMRCMTLAKALSQEGFDIVFVSAQLDDWSISEITKSGFDSLLISESHNNQHEDALATIKALMKFSHNKPDWLILDHYGLGNDWEEVVRDSVKHIMVIDDLADKKHSCELLLNQNYYSSMEKMYEGLIPDTCVKLLGPKYALLRNEFLHVFNNQRARNGEIKRVLVFFGGSDEYDLTSTALTALLMFPATLFQIDVIVGNSNPNKSHIKKITNSFDHIRVLTQVSNMAELMNSADVAIGATGATTWERCLLGLPTITINFAHNQTPTSQYLHSVGAIDLLGWIDTVSAIDIANRIQYYLDNPFQLVKLSKKARGVLSGWEGVKAVTRNINNLMHGEKLH